ncbi:MAG: exodeoxyribonuclease VII small subunit [Elusimicrobiota bacterium]
MVKQKDSETFEQSIKKLEEIVNKLDAGNVELEKAVGLYEEGAKLSENCVSKLNEVKKRIDILVKKHGKYRLEPFDGKEILDEEEEDDE